MRESGAGIVCPVAARWEWGPGGAGGAGAAGKRIAPPPAGQGGGRRRSRCGGRAAPGHAQCRRQLRRRSRESLRRPRMWDMGRQAAIAHRAGPASPRRRRRGMDRIRGLGADAAAESARKQGPRSAPRAGLDKRLTGTGRGALAAARKACGGGSQRPPNCARGRQEGAAAGHAGGNMARAPRITQPTRRLRDGGPAQAGKGGRQRKKDRRSTQGLQEGRQKGGRIPPVPAQAGRARADAAAQASWTTGTARKTTGGTRECRHHPRPHSPFFLW